MGFGRPPLSRGTGLHGEVFRCVRFLRDRPSLIQRDRRDDPILTPTLGGLQKSISPVPPEQRTVKTSAEPCSQNSSHERAKFGGADGSTRFRARFCIFPWPVTPRFRTFPWSVPRMVPYTRISVVRSTHDSVYFRGPFHT